MQYWLSMQSPGHFQGSFPKGEQYLGMMFSQLPRPCASYVQFEVVFYVSRELNTHHIIAIGYCRWYVMHIPRRAMLSPPTRELQLLRSSPRRKLLRKKLGRSIFALCKWCLDLLQVRSISIFVQETVVICGFCYEIFRCVSRDSSRYIHFA